jgi:protein ImuA
MPSDAQLRALRTRLAAIETGRAPERGALAFDDISLDGALGGAGLPLGRWHEVAGEGLEAETGAAAGAFVAALAAPLAARGAVVWVMRRGDLYAPGLTGLGFPAERLIQVRARDEDEALAVLEDALASAGISAAIAETGAVDLTAGRRLQLACEAYGATGFVIRRHPFGGKAREAGQGGAYGSVATTRWRIAPAPSAPPSGEPGLGPPRWRAALERARGGRPGVWLMELRDGPHPLRVVAELGDRQLASPPFPAGRIRRAAG